MGLLVDGVWHDVWYDTQKSQGAFERPESVCRQWIKADGSTPFAPEAGRYHLYVAAACPWAHRTVIYRSLKKLETIVSLSCVHPLMREHGWEFRGADAVNGCDYLHQVYVKSDATYNGRVTVPVLWDKTKQLIVSNESSEIIRMFNSEFNALTGDTHDYYPQQLRPDIDAMNAWTYDNINNGVYQAGFATTQQAYQAAVADVFAALDKLDHLLENKRYLLGAHITEADWRVFPTLLRFDSVYHGHFKCNRRMLTEYANIWGYMRDLYQVPGIAETIDMPAIMQHYYASHLNLNPSGIVPVGPQLAWHSAHGRESLGSRTARTLPAAYDS